MRLAPGSIPAHADSCEDYNNIGMPNAVQVRLAYITAADITPSSPCRARHSPVPVLSGCTLTRSLLLPQSLPWQKLCRPRRGLFWSCRGGSKELILSAWFWRGLHFPYVNVRVTVCMWDRDYRFPMENAKWHSGVSKKLKIFWPRRGGASRPARPRRLKAGAARLGLFTKKPI